MDRCRSQIINSIKKCFFSDSDSKSHDHANKNMNQKSISTEDCKVISNLLLPDDLIFDILTFVPVNCLINSAMYVCKLWAATISSSGFAEAHERRARSKHGIYVESFMSGKSSYFLEFKDDVNGQFERIDLEIPRRMGIIIGTCDDILLLLNIYTQMFVVNPILKCWLRIPPFPSSLQRRDVSRQCTIARVPRTSKFKLFLVIVLEISSVVWYVFYVLRIGIDNSWEEITRKETPHGEHEFRKPIYSGGNDLYWITDDEVIVMDVDNEIIVREYPPPIALQLTIVPTFLWMENRLFCMVRKFFCKSYQIEILDFDSGKWSLYHKMRPFDYVAVCGQEFNGYIFPKFCFGINDQIICEVKHQYFGYNVKTKKSTKIKGIANGRSTAWLHTNSLVSLSSTPT